jgi:drug/metabolite transporter (DMT)-like permease
VTTWLVLALVAPFIFSSTILIDKFIVEIQKRHVWGLALFTTLMGLVFGTLFWALGGQVWLPHPAGLVILATGVLTIWGGIFYFKALSLETSSAITVLLNLQPPIILALSWSFLGESLNASQALGFFLVLAVALAYSAERTPALRSGFRLSPALGWVLAANILWSVGVILFKWAATPQSFFTGAAYESWGIFVGGTAAGLAFPRIRRDFWQVLRSRPSTLAVIAFNESLFVAGKSVQLLAFTLGPVALVSVLGSTSVFFTLVLATLLTLRFPEIYREPLAAGRLAGRAGWGALLAVGVWLIQA